jgi:hypothetical protein
MKAMREAIEKAMRDALEKAMREAMESAVLSGAGQTARTPQEGGVAAVDEALQRHPKIRIKKGGLGAMYCSHQTRKVPM